MKTEWTVVEVGIVRAARGIYDAEVGSSGGRCGTRPCTDVGEERCETNRAVSSVLEVIMYNSNNMMSIYTELKPKSRGKVNDGKPNSEHRDMERREARETKETQNRGGGHHNECFFFSS